MLRAAREYQDDAAPSEELALTEAFAQLDFGDDDAPSPARFTPASGRRMVSTGSAETLYDEEEALDEEEAELESEEEALDEEEAELESEEEALDEEETELESEEEALDEEQEARVVQHNEVRATTMSRNKAKSAKRARTDAANRALAKAAREGATSPRAKSPRSDSTSPSSKTSRAKTPSAKTPRAKTPSAKTPRAKTPSAKRVVEVGPVSKTLQPYRQVFHIEGDAEATVAGGLTVQLVCTRSNGELMANYQVRRAVVERLMALTRLGAMDAVAASHMIMNKAVYGATYDADAEAVIEHLLRKMEGE